MTAQEIVDTVSDLLKRPVTVETPDGRLIAYSLHDEPIDAIRLETLLNKGPSRATVEALKRRGIYETINSSPGYVRVPAIPEIGFVSRIATALRHQNEIVGYLWVIDEGLIISPYIETALDKATRQLAAELIQEQSTSALRESQRMTLVADMIAGTQPDEVLLLRAKSLGWKMREPFQVCVIRSRFAPLAQGALRDIERRLAVLLKGALCVLTSVIKDELVLVMFGDGVRRHDEIIDILVKELANYESSVVIGIGTAYEVATLAGKSYCEALRAIDIGSKLGFEASRFEYATMAAYEIVSCMPACKKRRDFGRRAVEKIIAYDESHGSDLLTTLDTFLDFYGKRGTAARRLNVHPNTLDYRMRKIRDLVGADLDDPNVRFLLHLWVKASRLGTIDPEV